MSLGIQVLGLKSHSEVKPEESYWIKDDGRCPLDSRFPTAYSPMTAQLTSTLNTTAIPGYSLPSVPAQGTRVILLRHGRSTLNDAGCYQGSSDQSQLTAQGRRHAGQVGQYLRHCPIDYLYTSPLQRAQQTVQALRPQLTIAAAIPVTTINGLREINLPAWEGLPYNEVKTRFPEAYHQWQTAPETFAMAKQNGGIESGSDGGKGSRSESADLIYPVQEVYQRSRQFWKTTLPQHPEQTLLVVSHGGTIQALVNTALGLPMRHHHHLQQTHAGLTVIDFAAPTLGTGHLHLLNLTTPLGEPLPKLKAGKQGVRLLLLPCQSGTQPDVALANLVKEHPIAACIVEDHPGCHRSQRLLFTHHPAPMTFAVGQTNFLHQWQRSLRQSLGQMSPTELITIAAVCHHAHAESFLQAIVGRSIPLLPNALTVLHYPGVGRHPILQTLNSRPIPGN